MDKAKYFEKGFEEYKAKRKQEIEELGQDIYDNCPDLCENGCGGKPCYKCIAEALHRDNYRKIPENAVVLTREELFRDSTQLSKEKQIEIIHNIILENLDYGYEETATAIYDANYRKIPKLGVILPFDHYDNLLKTDKQVRKDTAKEILQMIDDDRNGYWDSCDCGKDETYWRDNSIQGTLNEIKERYGVEVE